MDLRIICAVLFAIVLNHYFQTATSSLTCYSCTATLGHSFRCENLSYSGGGLPYFTCMYADAVCAKYIIEYGDSLMIHRSCQHRDICAVLASKYNTYYSRVLDCQTCDDQNYCNSTSVATFVPALVLLLLIMVFLLH